MTFSNSGFEAGAAWSRFFCSASVIYYGYLYFRGTRGAKVLTGLAIVFLTLTLISTLLNLVVIGWIVRSFSVFLAIALVVIFQPELRRGLAELGGHPIFSLTSEKRETVHDLAEAVTQLANKQFGALIAIERDTSIRVYEETGVTIDSRFFRRADPDDFSSQSGVARWRRDHSQRANRRRRLHFPGQPARNARSQPRPAPSRRTRHHRGIGRGRHRRFGGDRQRFPFAIAAELSAILLPRRFASASPNFYCTAIMKKLILKNWRAKLISLLLATTLWYLIKKNVATTPSRSELRPVPAQTR